jgi:hypothetical protein
MLGDGWDSDPRTYQPISPHWGTGNTRTIPLLHHPPFNLPISTCFDLPHSTCLLRRCDGAPQAVPTPPVPLTLSRMQYSIPVRYESSGSLQGEASLIAGKSEMGCGREQRVWNFKRGEMECTRGLGLGLGQGGRKVGVDHDCGWGLGDRGGGGLGRPGQEAGLWTRTEREGEEAHRHACE